MTSGWSAAAISPPSRSLWFSPARATTYIQTSRRKRPSSRRPEQPQSSPTSHASSSYTTCRDLTRSQALGACGGGGRSRDPATDYRALSVRAPGRRGRRGGHEQAGVELAPAPAAAERDGEGGRVRRGRARAPFGPAAGRVPP